MNLIVLELADVIACGPWQADRPNHVVESDVGLGLDDGDVEVGLAAVVARMGGRFQDLYVVSSSSSFVGSQVRVADTNLPMPEKLPRSNLWSPTSRGQDQPQWAFDEN